MLKNLMKKQKISRLRVKTIKAIRLAINELYYDRISPHLTRFLSSNQLQIWFLALTIGISVGVLALGFRELIGVFQWLWLGTRSEQISEILSNTSPIILFFAPVLGGVIVGQLLYHVLPSKRTHGVPDVIESKAINGCKIEFKTGFWSAIITAISLGFGGSAGREGPVVHLGATFSSLISHASKISHANRRTLLAAGVAAAVSSSFNAPIAGVLFAHEVILAHYALSAFVPIVLASVAGTVIARITIGEFPAFLVPEYAITSYLEFPAFALLGIVAALVAIIFQLSLSTTERIAWSINIPIWLRPVIGGIMVGSIAVFYPEVLGVGYATTDNALKQNLGLTLLLALLIAKTAATAITLASRFGGGIFSPSLYLGACAGGAFGIIAASVFPEASSSNGLYAILGMGGVAAAVLGAPISTTMIVFELTGGYELTIALLLTVAISTALSQAVLGMSFFHWQLSTRGLFFSAGPHQQIANALTVKDFYSPIINDDKNHEEVKEDMSLKTTLLPDDNIKKALRLFNHEGTNQLPVLAGKHDLKVIGWANHIDALNAYNKALIEAHEEQHQ